jgi:glycosyltransferase involved in cell wall biosynthesis
MLVMRHGRGDDPSVTVLDGSGIADLRSAAGGAGERAAYRLLGGDPRYTWSAAICGSRRIARHELVRSTDVIALGWITAGFLTIRGIGALAALRKPIVWRLADMWPFTGGCHFSFGCTKYQSQCAACPQIQPRVALDLAWICHRRKREQWRALRPVFVAPSNWIAACVRRSSLFQDCRVEVIPTGIDTSVYRPMDREDARALLKLPQDKRLILFGAASVKHNPYKGYQSLVEAFQRAAGTETSVNHAHLVIFGSDDAGLADDFPIPVHNLGVLKDDTTKVLAYSASDVFVAPSVQDNLPNTVIESLACGTPVAAYATGGIPDLVKHGETGMLAPTGDSVQLARAIEGILEASAVMGGLRSAARQFAVSCLEGDRVAGRYEALYRELAALSCPGSR